MKFVFKANGLMQKRAQATQERAAKKKDVPTKTPLPPLYKRLFTKQARFALLIGDEGTILLYMKGDAVLSRQFVPDASDGNLDDLRETIAKDRQAPITMIIDSVDQSFVQQTLPPVSSLSVKKLIKRRLERDFKPDDIKGAILLGRDKGGRKDWNFLMVSVERSPQLILWLDFIMTFENRFRGIVLLSVEAGIFIKNVERSLGISPKTGTGAEWKIIVSHNKVGGFRQIILRNGSLIFTRLALPVGEPTPEVIAGNIEQEMLSTIEYLKRFGYNARNGLDVYIIASEEVCGLVDPARFEAQTFHAFSPHVMAQHLGIKGATQAGDQFGDAVLAAAVGEISKNILKLTTVESRLYDKYQLMKYGQRLLGTFIILGLIIHAAYIGYGSLIVRSDAEDADQKQRLSQQALEALKKQIADSKIDIDRVGNQIELYKQIRGEARSPVPFFNLLSQAVKPPVILKSVQWKMGNAGEMAKGVPQLINFDMPIPKVATPVAPGSTSPKGAPPEVDLATAVLALEFPVGLKSPALFKKFSDDFLKEMHTVLKDYAIVYSNVPAEYLDMKSLQMNFDQTPSENTLGQAPIPIEVTIRGPVTPPPPSPESPVPAKEAKP